MVSVDLDVLFPLIRNIFVSIDRLNRAGWLAGAAINTFVRMDKELLRTLELGFIFARVYAIDRADINTSRILRTNARFANYVNSHYANLLQYSCGISDE